MKADIKGIISDLGITDDDVLLPIYEAVVNSIQSVNENQSSKGKGLIIVDIERDREQTELFNEFNNFPIKSISITDNGVGLTKLNFKSFNTAHSTKKIKIGGKGLGRFTMLAVFDKIEIESYFNEQGEILKRSILFDENYKEDENNKTKKSDKADSQTIFSFRNLKERFKKPSAWYNHEEIANNILRHCLLYYLNQDVPTIIIREGGFDINLSNQFQPKDFLLFSEKLKIAENEFIFYGIKEEKASKHEYSLTAHNRRVKGEAISNFLPVFKSPIATKDGDTEYFINIYITSDFLDSRVSQTRNDIRLDNESDSNKKQTSLSTMSKITQATIRSEVSNVIFKHFETLLEERKKERELVVNNFLSSEEGIEYRWLEINDKLLDSIPDNVDNKTLDKIFHEHHYKTSKQLKEKREKLLTRDYSEKKEYKDLMNDVLSLVKLENSSKLASYVSHRKVIIDLLDKYLNYIDETQKYEEEKTLHNLFFTMGGTEKTVSHNSHNLWLIDERLSYHTYIRSDIAQDKHNVISSDSKKEPDVAIYDVNFKYGEETESGEIQSIVLVEFKRPDRNLTYEEYNTQMKDQIKGINKGFKDSKGQRVSLPDTSPIYYYYICDINAFNTIKDDATRFEGFKLTPYKTLIKMTENMVQEIITYQTLKVNAKLRNLRFFKELGIQ